MAIPQTNSCVRFPAANAQFEFHFYAVIPLPPTLSRNYIVSLLLCGARLWSIFRLILLFADQLTCTSAAGAAIRQGNQHIIHTEKEQWVRGGRCKPSRVIKVALGHIRIHIPIPSFRHPYYPSCTSSMTATAAAATTSAATLSFILIGFLLDPTTRFRSWGAAKGASADRYGRGLLVYASAVCLLFWLFPVTL